MHRSITTLQWIDCSWRSSVNSRSSNRTTATPRRSNSVRSNFSSTRTRDIKIPTVNGAATLRPPAERADGRTQTDERLRLAAYCLLHSALFVNAQSPRPKDGGLRSVVPPLFAATLAGWGLAGCQHTLAR